MNRCPETRTGRVVIFEGWNVGAVSVMRVRLGSDGSLWGQLHRHEGEPARIMHELLGFEADERVVASVVTGPAASSIFALPYLPESICIEAAPTLSAP